MAKEVYKTNQGIFHLFCLIAFKKLYKQPSPLKKEQYSSDNAV
jgi:hypothetical protein